MMTENNIIPPPIPTENNDNDEDNIPWLTRAKEWLLIELFKVRTLLGITVAMLAFLIINYM
jgi:hypothetical protein